MRIYLFVRVETTFRVLSIEARDMEWGKKKPELGANTSRYTPHAPIPLYLSPMTVFLFH